MEKKMKILTDNGYKAINTILNREEFVKIVKDYATKTANLHENGMVNWDYVDADLHLDNWVTRIPANKYFPWFNEAAEEYSVETQQTIGLII